MNTKWQRFAPIGLYLSLAALIAAAGLYIVQREWNLYLQIALGLVIIGLALFAVLDPERVRVALTGRQARYGSNALVMTLAFVGILVVINYIAYQYPQKWDLTEDKTNTLDQVTLDTLKSLPQPVMATAFYPQGVVPDTAQKLLDNYKNNSHGKFNYKTLDPNANPLEAQAANVTLSPNGTIVLAMGDRQEKVTSANEQDMDAALVQLMAKKMAVYFLTGHGEHSPDDTSDQGYSDVKSALEKKSYTVQTLNLISTNKIPDDAKAIIIAGPKKPLQDSEMKLLSDWVAKGNSLIVMEEPTITTDYGTTPDPLVDYLNKTWGIDLGDNIILDGTSSQSPFEAFAAQYATSHPITDKLQRMVTGFPTARSVSASKTPPSGVTLTELIKTADAPQSWAETDLAGLKNNQQPTPDPKTDLMGPVPLAVAGEQSSPKARIVVIGDSDFAINAIFNFYGNGDLLLNSVDWTTEQENLINLNPKTPTTRVIVAPTKYTLNLILLGTVFVLPGMVLVSGVVVFIQRRRRG